MIDNGISPKVSSPDLGAYAGSASGASKSDGRGFNDALNNVGQQHQHKSSKTEDKPTQHSAEQGAQESKTETTTEQPAEAPAPRVAKPLIDIRYRGPLQLKAGDDMPAPEHLKVSVDSVDGKRKGTEKVKLELADGAEQAEVPKGKAVTEDEQLLSHVKLKAGTETEVEAKTEVDSSSTKAAETSLDDMLTLLTVATDDTAVAQAGQTQPKGKSGKDDTAGQPDSVKGRKDVAAGVAAGLKSVADIADTDGAEMSSESTDAADLAFRLVRADGKGSAMSVRVGEASAEANAERAVGSREAGPTVTILDARRFLAPVSDTNSANISAALLGDDSWVEAMRSAGPVHELDNAGSGAGKVVNTLKIQMTPIELGLVTANLRLAGETLSIQLTVENHAAQRKLQEDSSEIIKALKAQGFAVDQVQISVTPTVRADNDGSATAQQNTAGQQQMQQGGQGSGAGGQRSQPEARGQEFGNAMGMKTDEAVATQGTPTGRAGSARPGQLYL